LRFLHELGVNVWKLQKSASSTSFQFSLHEIQLSTAKLMIKRKNSHFQFSLHEIHGAQRWHSWPHGCLLSILPSWDSTAVILTSSEPENIFQFSLHEIPPVVRLRQVLLGPFNSPFMRFAGGLGGSKREDSTNFQFSLHEIPMTASAPPRLKSSFQFSLHEIHNTRLDS